MRFVFICRVTVMLALILCGCGRYLPPSPPEQLAPATIEFISAIPDESGVTFTWKAPSNDLRGKKLKQIDGYEVLRSDVTESTLITLELEEIEFTKLTEIPDTHLKELKALQDDAEARGQVVHKVKIDDIKKVFSYRDPDLKAGAVYLYKIVPINQGSVEGQAAQLYRVTFNGLTTVVEPIPNVGENSGIFS